jgi:hypothetical protein
MNTTVVTFLIAASLFTPRAGHAAGARGVETFRPRNLAGEIDQVKLLPEREQPVIALAKTRIPQSLDLRNMARWSLNYLTGSITAEKNFASSYGNWPLDDPPFCVGGDRIAVGDSEVRNDLAFVLMRAMSGISYGATVQKGLRERILAYQHTSGLFNPPAHGDTDVLWATAWAAQSLIESYATTGDRVALARAEKALKAVRKFAIVSNDQGQLRLSPPRELKLVDEIIHFAYRKELDFCIVEPFVRYYEVTADATMLAVARGVADGRLAGFGQYDSGHMHSQMHGVVPIAHLGAVTGQTRYLDWAEAQLDRRAHQRTDYGWVEATGGYGASETCAFADFIHICLYLGRGGRTRHYDFVERALLNYLPQEQFFTSDATFQTLWKGRTYKDRANHLALMRRLEGGFLCRTDPEDRWSKPTISLEGCCPPTGMTALYQAWKDLVRKTDEGVRVNLAISHESPEARVVSFLPGSGRVTVVPRIVADYLIRIPGFVRWDTVRAFRGQPEPRQVEVIRNGEYVLFKNASACEELSVTYPLVQFIQKTKAGGKDLAVHWKGNFVTGLSPRGKVWPLFEKVPASIPEFRPFGPGTDEGSADPTEVGRPLELLVRGNHLLHNSQEDD